MTSSILAAILAIIAALFILFSPRKIGAAALVLAFVTLGYISGNSDTKFGSFVQNIVDGVTAVINWIASLF